MFYLDQLCDIFSSKLPFIFAMTTYEEVSVPIMMEFYRFILGHLFHFVCHLDHFFDDTYEIHVHVSNQHA